MSSEAGPTAHTVITEMLLDLVPLWATIPLLSLNVECIKNVQEINWFKFDKTINVCISHFMSL